MINKNILREQQAQQRDPTTAPSPVIRARVRRGLDVKGPIKTPLANWLMVEDVVSKDNTRRLLNLSIVLKEEKNWSFRERRLWKVWKKIMCAFSPCGEQDTTETT